MTQIPSSELADGAVEWALAKKAEDIAVIDLKGIYDVTDAFVVVSGASEVQVRAIADSIVEGATKAGAKPLHVEGLEAGNWVLIDFVDVIVHVMLPETRRYYALERLWGDAPVTRYDEAGHPLPTVNPESDGRAVG